MLCSMSAFMASTSGLIAFSSDTKGPRPAMDHGARWARYAAQAVRLRAAIADLVGVRATPMYFTMDERLVPEPVNALVIELPGNPLPPGEIAARLAAGDPAIACVAEADKLIFCFDLTDDAEVDAIGHRLRAVLT